MGAAQNSVHIDRQQPRQVVDVAVRELAGNVDAGICAEHIDRAESVQRARDHVFNVRGRGHVRADDQRLAADFVRQRLHFVDRAGGQRQFAALRRQQPRECLADAAARARDDGNLAV